MAKALTTEEFIQKAKVVHGEKYDYSLVEYATKNIPVVIICPKHGQFITKPSNHMRSGCTDCWKESRKTSSGPNALTTEEFILKAKAVHGELYDYSETEYLTKRTRIAFKCEAHGRIEQFPLNHLSSSGCKHCSNNSQWKKPRKKNARRVTDIESFIAWANRIHESYYIYDKSVFTGAANQIIITCPKHGEFLQKAANHLSGFTCKQCSLDKLSESFSFDTARFIDSCQSVHGDEYDYSNTTYTNSQSKVTVTCKKHGPFEVLALHHVRGTRCQKCGLEDKTQSTEAFLESAKIIHGDMYDYSETDYINNNTKVAIICKDHGTFFQLPRSHISSRTGCPTCNEVDFWDINNLTELQKLAPNGLYVMHMRSEDHSEEFIKVGISKDSERRIKEIELQSGYIVTLQFYMECNTKTALEHEKSLHDELYDYNYKPKSKFAGRTECFDLRALPILESKSFLTFHD